MTILADKCLSSRDLIKATTIWINRALDSDQDAGRISSILNDHYCELEKIEISEISLTNKCAFRAVNQAPVSKDEIYRFIQAVRQNPEKYSALNSEVLAKECKESKLLEESVLYAYAKYKGYQEVRLVVDEATAKREGVDKFQHFSDLYYITHDTGLDTRETLYVGYKNQHFSHINTAAVSKVVIQQSRI